MKKVQKGFASPLIMILIAILAISSGVYAYINSKESTGATKSEGTPLKFFKDKEVGFSFSFPKEWGDIKREDFFDKYDLENKKLIQYTFSDQGNVEVRTVSYNYGQTVLNESFGLANQQGQSLTDYCKKVIGRTNAPYNETNDTFRQNGSYVKGDCDSLPLKIDHAEKIRVFPRESFNSKIELNRTYTLKLNGGFYKTLGIVVKKIDQIPTTLTCGVNENCLNYKEKALIDTSFSNFNLSNLGVNVQLFVDSLRIMQPTEIQETLVSMDIRRINKNTVVAGDTTFRLRDALSGWNKSVDLFYEKNGVEKLLYQDLPIDCCGGGYPTFYKTDDSQVLKLVTSTGGMDGKELVILINLKDPEIYTVDEKKFSNQSDSGQGLGSSTVINTFRTSSFLIKELGLTLNIDNPLLADLKYSIGLPRVSGEATDTTSPTYIAPKLGINFTTKSLESLGCNLETNPLDSLVVYSKTTQDEITIQKNPTVGMIVGDYAVYFSAHQSGCTSVVGNNQEVEILSLLRRAILNGKTSTAPALSSDVSRPLITSISRSSGSVGAVIEIKGFNLIDARGDQNVIIENTQGETASFSNGNLITSNTEDKLTSIKVMLAERVCNQWASDAGLPCKTWMNIVPGKYYIYVDGIKDSTDLGKPLLKSNKVPFTVLLESDQKLK